MKDKSIRYVPLILLCAIQMLLSIGCSKNERGYCALVRMEKRELLAALAEMEASYHWPYGKPLINCLSSMLENKQYEAIANQLFLLRHGSPPDKDPVNYLSKYDTDEYNVGDYHNARILGFWVGAFRVAIHEVYYNELLNYYDAAAMKVLHQIFLAAAKSECPEFKRTLDSVFPTKNMPGSIVERICIPRKLNHGSIESALDMTKLAVLNANL